MISTKPHRFVTLTRKCFDLEYHGEIPGNRDGVLHDFRLHDVAAKSGVLRISVFRAGARTTYAPTILEYDRREGLVIVNVIRRAFDHDRLDFDARTDGAPYTEIPLQPSDFAQQPRQSDKDIKPYIIAKAYLLSYLYPVAPQGSGHPIAFDDPVDLDYLGVGRPDILRVIGRMANQRLLDAVRDANAKPTEELLTLYESGPHADVTEVTEEWETTTIEEEDDHPAEVRKRAISDLLVLISHSSKDKRLAEALITLLRAGLRLSATQIRCTSVDGYRLPGGANTNDQLLREIKTVNVLVGLLTPNSLASTYVLFELGARWGVGLPMIPLLAGISAAQMRGPDNALNALSCDSEAQLVQLVEDIGRELHIEPDSSASYLSIAHDIKGQSESIAALARENRKSESTPASPTVSASETFVFGALELKQPAPHKPMIAYLRLENASSGGVFVERICLVAKVTTKTSERKTLALSFAIGPYLSRETDISKFIRDVAVGADPNDARWRAEPHSADLAFTVYYRGADKLQESQIPQCRVFFTAANFDRIENL
jgi:hypothetical protein